MKDGNYLYTLSFSQDAFSIIDVSDPSNPIILSALTDTMFD
ncbi:MAG: hypothetical protein LBQ59_01520 [Candidatus Peribacteria bacterium]|nr:hypothetical protein [Candidatus Peribacteria bacterium]